MVDAVKDVDMFVLGGHHCVPIASSAPSRWMRDCQANVSTPGGARQSGVIQGAKKADYDSMIP